MGNTCLPQGGALIPARARLQTCSRPAPAPAAVFVRLEARGVPPCHMKGTSARWAGDPFPEGRRWRAPAPSCQTRLRFQQGAWEPHKGNGKRLSHPGARLLPGLLAHNGTFVKAPPQKAPGLAGWRQTFQGAEECSRRGGLGWAAQEWATPPCKPRTGWGAQTSLRKRPCCHLAQGVSFPRALARIKDQLCRPVCFHMACRLEGR